MLWRASTRHITRCGLCRWSLLLLAPCPGEQRPTHHPVWSLSLVSAVVGALPWRASTRHTTRCGLCHWSLLLLAPCSGEHRPDTSPGVVSVAGLCCCWRHALASINQTHHPVWSLSLVSAVVGAMLWRASTRHITRCGLCRWSLLLLAPCPGEHRPDTPPGVVSVTGLCCCWRHALASIDQTHHSVWSLSLVSAVVGAMLWRASTRHTTRCGLCQGLSVAGLCCCWRHALASIDQTHHPLGNSSKTPALPITSITTLYLNHND